MKRTFTVLNLEQNAPQQCNSEKQKIYNMPVNEYFSWLNGHILHNSLTKKNRENILELAKKEKMSLEEATAIISGKKRSNQSHPQ
ncbi:MAG TPA: hypothetical protein VL201_03365 [Patescibacteria group bacterium]|jgi:hypothetical protein|nr:hypothetical protein [Patescibacteria group bacterium]